ncbi:predicted protein [Thalassiosira pseudonana CCMP1335]|uniref:Prolyl 4-hydroxylase alpha subunit domain-containing protein n=1 Tax=Thalassiosira pseudonana TaxID=35128 RepID=B8BPY4_THAPS|nr:predicted protein [Thalassiosira pseudonana CCMP1335]EED95691.1 predicted protein [Thalassiosira pseudonana CCMP1335]|eukprot:scaffold4206_cov196-Alexandrium_tamarense.AAC.16
MYKFTLYLVSILHTSSALSVLPESALNTIDRGGIAIVPNFISPSEVSRLRSDASNLYNDGNFIVDALAGYGNKAGARDKAKFDTSKDRAVFPAYIPSKHMDGPFVSPTLGDADGRQSLTRLISALRSDLAKELDRPGIDTPFGGDNHEISYTRFGAGALLARHVDEHHEEVKGRAGWSRPTRRSISWLIYLNDEDWDANSDGGCLRTYERKLPSAFKVGSRDGDLQIGWLTPTASDPKERPVFLDGRRGGISGKCALYVDSDDGQRKAYLTKEFESDPYLFLTSDFFIQNLLIQDHALGARFHYLEQPKSALTAYFGADSGETFKDVPPLGGTLVAFDSVALPHEVLPTLKRERWAASGWFHEKQQPVPMGGQIII